MGFLLKLIDSKRPTGCVLIFIFDGKWVDSWEGWVEVLELGGRVFTVFVDKTR